MNSTQIIRKNSVQNLYYMGTKIQKWCKSNLNLVLDSIECGYMDGGCRVLSEALIEWSNNYLTLKGVVSQQGTEHIVATFNTSSNSVMCLDSDGLATTRDMFIKMKQIEGVDCDKIITIDDKCSINNYRDTHPDLIPSIVAKLKQDLGEFKPAMLMRGIKHETLQPVAQGKFLKEPIYDFENVLKNQNLRKIPKTSSASDVLSFLFNDVKTPGDIDYMAVFRTLSIRDGWSISDDDYIEFMKLHSRKIEYPRYQTQHYERLLQTPPWGEKAAKYLYTKLREDLHQTVYSKMVLQLLSTQMKKWPFISTTKEDDLITYSDNKGKIWTDNKEEIKLYNLNELLKTKDTQGLIDLCKTVNHNMLCSDLVSAFTNNNAYTDLAIKTIFDNIKITDCGFNDLLVILDNMKPNDLDDTLRNLLMQRASSLKMDHLEVYLTRNAFDDDFRADFMGKLLNEQNSTGLSLYFKSVFEYPILEGLLTSELKLRIVDCVLKDKYFNIYYTEGKYAGLQSEDVMLELITYYLKDDYPDISNMIQTAISISPENSFKTFKQLYQAKDITIESDLALPSI